MSLTDTGFTEHDIEKLRADFPILSEIVYDKKLIYLDNAATTQKPQTVIDTVSHYYANSNANVHRGVHVLSERATKAYEESRQTVCDFIHAHSTKEIVFTRGTTEAINLVAQSLGRMTLSQGDEILITEMEHHSNIVPWQMICEQTGAKLKVASINDKGECPLESLQSHLSENTKIVSIVHLSNALGTINPIKEMTALCKKFGAYVVVDGAQAVSHLDVNVQDIGCDFYAFSGHKAFGPTGIGVLYGKEAVLEKMPPYQGGGEMISMVTFERTTYNALPYKFEAGTPNIAGAIGLKAALDYIRAVDIKKIKKYEDALLTYATEAIATVEGVRIIGQANDKSSVLSFVVADIHPHDIGTILDHQGIAIRAGHHCAMPVMQRFALPATARASFAFYNTREEVDALVAGVAEAKRLFL